MTTCAPWTQPLPLARLFSAFLPTARPQPALPVPVSLPGTGGRRWRLFGQRPGCCGLLLCGLGCQGQGHELREDPWSWVSGWGLGASCSSRHPSAHLATSSSPAKARTWPLHPQNLQAIAPRLGNPPLASVGDRGGGPGVGGSPCTYPAIPTPRYYRWFCFYFNFFGFDFF